MIRYKPTTNSRRFTAITVNVQTLDTMIAKDGFPFHIGPEGRTDDRLPWFVQAKHVCCYCDQLAEIAVDEIAAHPVLRLSMPDEIATGRSPITVEAGQETLAAFRDLGIKEIEVEVLWREATEIEARLLT